MVETSNPRRVALQRSWVLGRLPRLRGRIGSSLLAAIGLAGPAQGAGSQPVDANAVPGTWAAYAGPAAAILQSRFASGTDAAAIALHRFLEDRAALNPAAEPPSPIVRVWIGADGAITRLEFASLGDPAADQDLRAVLVATRLPPSPPPHMPQPLVLRLRLAYPS